MIKLHAESEKCLHFYHLRVMFSLKNSGFGDELDGEKIHHQIMNSRFSDMENLIDSFRIVMECFYFLMPYQKYLSTWFQE